MLHPNDDLFAPGVFEPQSATLCNVVGIDDLIILGVIAAVTVAASQVSASEQESAGKENLDWQKKNQMRAQQLNFYKRQQDEAAARTQARYGAGGVSQSEALQPFADKQAIDNQYDYGMRAVDRQADMTRTNGYIQAGGTLASGLASQALRPASSGSNFVAGAGYEGIGQGIGDRAGGYDLGPAGSQLLGGASQVATAPLHSSDPSGGYQLQPHDYQLLQGGGIYSQSPYADDEYGTQVGLTSPRSRYGFTL